MQESPNARLLGFADQRGVLQIAARPAAEGSTETFLCLQKAITAVGGGGGGRFVKAKDSPQSPKPGIRLKSFLGFSEPRGSVVRCYFRGVKSSTVKILEPLLSVEIHLIALLGFCQQRGSR